MDSATKILDIAERRMRQTGYNAVSYRDIAGEIGIKSASLHYHFPKKEDLGVALVQRYAESFREHLVEKTEPLNKAEDYIAAFVEIYRYELKEQHLVCLCAVLGAESPGLPKSVAAEVQAFFTENLTWLEAQYVRLESNTPARDAKVTLSLLEGAMIISSVSADYSVFDAAADSIMDAVNST